MELPEALEIVRKLADGLVYGCRHVGCAEHCRLLRPEDTGFLRADELERIAEPLAVIETYRSEHRHVGVDEIGGVKTAAEADFEHCGIHARARENE